MLAFLIGYDALELLLDRQARGEAPCAEGQLSESAPRYPDYPLSLRKIGCNLFYIRPKSYRPVGSFTSTRGVAFLTQVSSHVCVSHSTCSTDSRAR